MKTRIWTWVIIGFLGVLFLGGCSGKTEIEDLGYVMGIGIDLGEKPGFYAVTYQMVIPQSGGTNKPWNITVEAKTLREARTYVNEIFDRDVFVGTTRVMVIGEEAARTGIAPMIDITQRFYEYRRTLYLVLAKGKAADILNLELKSESAVALTINTLIEQTKEITRVPVARLGHFLTVMGTEGKQPLLAIVNEISPNDDRVHYKSESGEPENIQMKAAGAFREDKLEVILTEKETQGALFLLNEVKKQVVSVEGKNSVYAGKIYKASTKSKLITKDDHVGIHYKINLEVDLEEIQDQEFKSQKDLPEMISRAQGLIEHSLQECCQLTIQKAKEEQLDFLAIGRTIQMKDPKLWNELKDNWEERLPDIPIEIEVNAKIRNIGTSFQSPGTNR